MKPVITDDIKLLFTVTYFQNPAKALMKEPQKTQAQEVLRVDISPLALLQNEIKFTSDNNHSLSRNKEVANKSQQSEEPINNETTVETASEYNSDSFLLNGFTYHQATNKKRKIKSLEKYRESHSNAKENEYSKLSNKELIW